MSSALIESPAAASQLYFVWSEACQETPSESVITAPTPRQVTPLETASVKNGSQQQAPQSARLARSTPAVSAKPKISQSVGTAADGSQYADRLSFSSEGRIQQPVRIGSVMIKLLKRYGITDQEIADGLASYALKSAHSQAS